MKLFIKIILLIISVICIMMGGTKLGNTYEIADSNYDNYVSSIKKDYVVEENDNYSFYQIPDTVEKYYFSTNIKQLLIINTCVLIFGVFLLLILIIDFLKWLNECYME